MSMRESKRLIFTAARVLPGITTTEIRRFRTLEIHTLVSDFTGTLSCGGKFSAEVKARIVALNERIDVHVVSSDSFGTAEKELSGLPVVFEKLSKASGPHDVAKLKYVEGLNPRHMAAFGNGNNDRLMLPITRNAGGLSVAVDNGEGCARDAFMNADLMIAGASNALNLLLVENGCKAAT